VSGREEVKALLEAFLAINCVGIARAVRRDEVVFQVRLRAEAARIRSPRICWRLLCYLKAELIDEKTLPVGECDLGWFVVDTDEERSLARARPRARALAELRAARAIETAYRARKERQAGADGDQLLLVPRTEEAVPVVSSNRGE
jgi:hypothetical protein